MLTKSANKDRFSIVLYHANTLNIDRAELLKEETDLLVFLFNQGVGAAEVARVVNGLRSATREIKRPKKINDEQWQVGGTHIL